jgi:hypothetical protein
MRQRECVRDCVDNGVFRAAVRCLWKSTTTNGQLRTHSSKGNGRGLNQHRWIARLEDRGEPDVSPAGTV